MYKRLIHYINKNGRLTDRQYGFRSKSSTNHAIIELVNKITKAIEHNEFTVGILLKKLYFYGIRGKCYAWIKDYLSNRKQIVKYNDIRSTEKNNYLWGPTRIYSWTVTILNIHQRP